MRSLTIKAERIPLKLVYRVEVSFVLLKKEIVVFVLSVACGSTENSLMHGGESAANVKSGIKCEWVRESDNAGGD